MADCRLEPVHWNNGMILEEWNSGMMEYWA